MRGVSNISACRFCVWCKSRKLGGRGSRRFPCVTPVVKKFSSGLFLAITSYKAESHLASCQTFTMDISPAKITSGFNMLTISTKSPPQMFDRTSNLPLIEGAVNVGCRCAASEAVEA